MRGITYPCTYAKTNFSAAAHLRLYRFLVSAPRAKIETAIGADADAYALYIPVLIARTRARTCDNDMGINDIYSGVGGRVILSRAAAFA